MLSEEERDLSSQRDTPRVAVIPIPARSPQPAVSSFPAWLQTVRIWGLGRMTRADNGLESESLELWPRVLCLSCVPPSVCRPQQDTLCLFFLLAHLCILLPLAYETKISFLSSLVSLFSLIPPSLC